jgi:hypothetical protein
MMQMVPFPDEDISKQTTFKQQGTGMYYLLAMLGSKHATQEYSITQTPVKGFLI